MKKKILLVSCEGLGNGGVQSVIMSIVRELSKCYIFDILLFTSEKRYYDDEFESYGGKIIRLPNYEGKNKIVRYLDIMFRRVWRIKQIEKIIAKNGPYDVIHCHNESESGLCLEAAFKGRIPIRISHFHIISGDENIIIQRLYKQYEQKIVKFATNIVGCSAEAIESKRVDIKGKVLYNPYDSDRYKSVEIDRDDSCFNLIQVGGYCENKNQLYSLKLFLELRKLFPKSKLRFVGFPFENGYKEKMELFIKKNMLEKHVIIYPSNADIPKLLAQSDYLLQPSKKEGFGVVLIEAQAMGCRCFASDTIPKITNCGGCIYFSLEDDIRDIAKKIYDDYQNNKGNRQVYDCKKFSKEYFCDSIKKIYGD